MNIKPEDRPKFIGLMVGILFVSLYFVFVVLPKFKAPPVAPPHAAIAAGTSPAMTLAQAAGSQTPANLTPLPGITAAINSVNDPSLPVPPTPHDPFKPAVSQSIITIIAASAKAHLIPHLGGPLGLPILAPALTPATVELQGVITGVPSIAVLRVNSEIVQKQEGSSLTAGLQLVKISEGGAFFHYRNTTFYLPVGHTATCALPSQPALTTQPLARGGNPGLPGFPVGAGQPGQAPGGPTDAPKPDTGGFHNPGPVPGTSSPLIQGGSNGAISLALPPEEAARFSAHKSLKAHRRSLRHRRHARLRRYHRRRG